MSSELRIRTGDLFGFYGFVCKSSKSKNLYDLKQKVKWSLFLLKYFCLFLASSWSHIFEEKKLKKRVSKFFFLLSFKLFRKRFCFLSSIYGLSERKQWENINFFVFFFQLKNVGHSFCLTFVPKNGGHIYLRSGSFGAYFLCDRQIQVHPYFF